MLNRREFIGLAAAGAAFAGLGAQKGRILFGACRGFGDAPLMKELGYDFIEGGVAHALQPDKSDEEWKRRRDEVCALPIPLRSCNGFLPGKFRLTGEKASFDKPLEYAEKACRRADEVGLKTIVFGSGGARNAPKGFPKEKAVEQFVDFCKRLAGRIADCKVCVVLEPLQPKEANYLNFVREGCELCERIGSPRIRLLADIFHMLQGGEGAQSIEQTTPAFISGTIEWSEASLNRRSYISERSSSRPKSFIDSLSSLTQALMSEVQLLQWTMATGIPEGVVTMSISL